MESRHRPKHSDVTVGRTSVEGVAVVQSERDPVGFGRGIRPFENLFRPVHPKVRGDFSRGDEFVLARVPEVVGGFAVFELRFRIPRNPGVGRMNGQARQSPGGRSFESVVRILLMEAEVLRKFATDEVFLQKRLLVFVGSRRAVYGEKGFFRRQVAVAEMRRESRRSAGIGIVATFGVSRKPEFDEAFQEFSGSGFAS